MKLYKNILTEKERKKLLTFVKTQVRDLSPKCPGLQTLMDLHTFDETKHFYNLVMSKYFKNMTIENSWGNYCEGDEINWHNHPTCKLSAVYFLQNSDSLGTMFRDERYNWDKITSPKCPQNSLLVFDGNKVHSQPYSPKKIKRYSIAIDLI